MEVNYVKYCNECCMAITPNQRWVRFKIPGTAFYEHFHSDAPEGEMSCWDKASARRLYHAAT